MKKNKSKKSINIVLAVIIIVIIGATVMYVINSSKSSVDNSFVETTSITINKYSSSLDRIDKTLKSLDSEFFNRKIFSQLKSFISLPLEIGLIGKENPFDVPLAPEELLLMSLE